MLKIIVLSLIILNSFNVQSQITFSEYKVEDEFSMNYKERMNGISTTLTYRLVSIVNINTKDTIQGIEIEVKTSTTDVTLSSFSLSNFNSLWGQTANLSIEKKEYNGIYFVYFDEAIQTFEYLNKKFVEIFGQKPQYTENYKVTINDKVEMGYLWDQNRGEWLFFTAIDTAVYQVPLHDGTKLIRKLSEFSR